MSADRRMRASDQDRERAAAVLGDAYATGRLDYDEFDERGTVALTARTVGELDDLTADLPRPRGGTAFPAEIVPSTSLARQARWCMITQMIWTLALVLAVGLAGRVIPAAAWAAISLVPLAMIVPFASRDISRALRRPR